MPKGGFHPKSERLAPGALGRVGGRFRGRRHRRDGGTEGWTRPRPERRDWHFHKGVVARRGAVCLNTGGFSIVNSIIDLILREMKLLIIVRDHCSI